MGVFKNQSSVDKDFLNQELLNARLQNLTNSQQTTLVGNLTIDDKGLIIYNTEVGKAYIWNGTVFNELTYTVSVGTFRGIVAHNDPAPNNPVTGDFVIFNSEGVATNFGGDTVQSTDMAWYTGTSWAIVQGNIKEATDTVAGIVRRATSVEASNASNVNAYTTPSQVGDLITSRTQAEFYENVVNLTAGTPITIAHNLGSVMAVQCFTGTSPNLEPIEVYWKQLSTTQVQLGSNVTLNGLTVRIFKKS